MQRTYLPPLLIIVAVLVSYGGFFYSPVTFDDIKFFSDEAISRFLLNFKPWLPRQLAYGTLALSWEWFGPLIFPLRLVSLFLHASTGIALYFFLQRVAGL
ncbi:membrane protein, partial [sediment metagenome]